MGGIVVSLLLLSFLLMLSDDTKMHDRIHCDDTFAAKKEQRGDIGQSCVGYVPIVNDPHQGWQAQGAYRCCRLEPPKNI